MRRGAKNEGEIPKQGCLFFTLCLPSRHKAYRSREKMDDTKYEVRGLLWVTRESEKRIRLFLADQGVPEKFVASGLHLTVYYGRMALPGIQVGSRTVNVIANTSETRFMPMTPGGESPRPEVDPNEHRIGLRLTKRNRAIGQIQGFRAGYYEREKTTITSEICKPTKAWTSAYGAPRYQPHITVLKPGSGIDSDLTKLGEAFRREIEEIEFGRLETKESHLS